jgi:hypothetical protein
MKCCIEIKYCLGVAITSNCDGFLFLAITTKKATPAGVAP